MKKKYQNMILCAAEMIGKIPRVNTLRETATASAYISAYNDYAEACNYLGIISAYVTKIEGAEKIVRKYKNRDGYDVENLKAMIEFYDEKIDDTYKDLKDFFDERQERQWR